MLPLWIVRTPRLTRLIWAWQHPKILAHTFAHIRQARLPDIGSPNFNAPEIVVRRASDYMRAGRYRYSSNWGLLSLRTALIQNVARMGGPQCDPENEIIITHGASEAVAIVIGSLLNGDEHFLVPTPTRPHYIADCHILNKRRRSCSLTRLATRQVPSIRSRSSRRCTTSAWHGVCCSFWTRFTRT